MLVLHSLDIAGIQHQSIGRLLSMASNNHCIFHYLSLINEQKIHVEEVISIKLTNYLEMLSVPLTVDAYAIHKLVLPGQYSLFFWSHNCFHLICPEKVNTWNISVCLWHLPISFTWCAMHTMSTFTILLTFIATFFVNFYSVIFPNLKTGLPH